MDELAILAGTEESVTRRLNETPSLRGSVVLSTCNRFEIYFDADTFHGGVEAVLTAVKDALPAEQMPLADAFEAYPEAAAAQHLLEVAAGLDSMVVGEDEIVGQVRQALTNAGERASAALTRLFHAALTTAKAIRNRTQLGAAGRSMATVGFDLVEQRHFPVAGRTALLVGTGSYAGVAVAALTRRGCTAIEAYSPSGRADQFAATHPVTPVTAAEFDAALTRADLLITCSGHGQADEPVLTADQLARARAGCRAVLPVLDFSLPGDVEPSAAALSGVDLVDLAEIGAHTPREHADALAEARELVNEGVETYLHLERGRAASPAIIALRAYVSKFIDHEIASAQSHYDADTAQAIASSLHRVSNALLHTPSVRAAELAHNGGLTDYQQALRTLFNLDVDTPA